MEPMLLKIPEVAARLGLSRAKVYELMSRGALRSVRVDGCRRVRTEDLVTFVASLDERGAIVAMRSVTSEDLFDRR